MSRSPLHAACLGALLILAAGSATAQAAPPAPAPGADDASDLRAQVLLDRARFSPGEIDGQPGSNQRRAVSAFQAGRGLAVSGTLDEATWQALKQDAAPALVAYTLTAEDVAGPFPRIPDDTAEKAKLPALGFESVEERLGERFHASPKLLRALNPGVDFAQAGASVQVPNVLGTPALPKAAKVVVDKSDSSVRLLDAAGKVLAQFPASTGSEHDPLPIGEWKIKGVVRQPTFHYNPKLFWDADKSDKKATLAAGPNNPVGEVWIDLSKDHYGIHGTPDPARVGKSQSHGCVRLTNWDVQAVAAAVDASVPVTMQE
ncbi:murein L,D-transpeptidase [Xanthomonas sp. AmX2]|uniref:L,D-transpeptidase family protein n=1 Tax=Xanthomonas sp. TaxID=29446 RepID=UPI00197DEA15|nr:L,D-transpeptidase [Xanthomonas sp.]MBN6152308.1 murein L,D-transpeptidase [Xanthomonas sp.]